MPNSVDGASWVCPNCKSNAIQYTVVEEPFEIKTWSCLDCGSTGHLAKPPFSNDEVAFMIDTELNELLKEMGKSIWGDTLSEAADPQPLTLEKLEAIYKEMQKGYDTPETNLYKKPKAIYCPKCKGAKISQYEDTNTLVCLKCEHEWKPWNQQTIQAASGLPVEEIVVDYGPSKVTFPIHHTTKQSSKGNASYYNCPNCYSELVPSIHTDSYECDNCQKSFSAFYILQNLKAKKKPIGSWWRSDLNYGQTEFRFDVEVRITPKKWFDIQGGQWKAIESEALYGEPKEATFAFSDYMIDRLSGSEIESMLFDMLLSTLRQGASGSGENAIEDFIERFVVAALKPMLDRKDWTKVPPVDEAWVKELDTKQKKDDTDAGS